MVLPGRVQNENCCNNSLYKKYAKYKCTEIKEIFVKKYLIITGFILSLLVFNRPTEARGGIGLVAGQPSGITFRINQFPVVTIGYSFLSDSQWIHGSLDFWALNPSLGGQFKWYLGLGANIGLYTNNNPIRLGLRVPIGIQWFPTEIIEIFLEAAPGVSVLPSIGFDWQACLGIRFMIFK